MYEDTATSTFSKYTLNRAISFTTPTGIRNPASMAALNLYPNPTADKINLSFPITENGTGTIRVIDANSNEIFHSIQNIMPGESVEITTGEFPSGIYQIICILGEKNYLGQFIKH